MYRGSSYTFLFLAKQNNAQNTKKKLLFITHKENDYNEVD